MRMTLVWIITMTVIAIPFAVDLYNPKHRYEKLGAYVSGAGMGLLIFLILFFPE